MSIQVHPRSVPDATRFTQTTPYATAAPGGSVTAMSSAPSSSRFQPPARPAHLPEGPGPGPDPVGETPAQKVARLRAAHLAAKNAQVSSLDRIVHGSRRLFDSAHRLTIVGLIGFTALAGLMTAYTAVDMLRYNRRRKVEFFAAQKQMDADSLAAARLAYMRGDATPAQTAIVEKARQAEAAAGANNSNVGNSSFFAVPSLLGAPAPAEKLDDTTPLSAATAPFSKTTPPPSPQGYGGPLDRIGVEGAPENRGMATAADAKAATTKSWW